VGVTSLSVEGFRGTPEEIERQWYEQVYRGRGDSRLQLTWRAVLMGSVEDRQHWRFPAQPAPSWPRSA